MIKINLLTVRVSKAVRLVQNQALVFIAVMVAAIVVAVMWTGSVFAAKATADSQLVAEKANLVRLESVTKKTEEFEAKKKRREEILAAIRRLEERKQGPRPYFDQLNMLLPPDVWLTDVTASGSAINIVGYSFSNNAIADLMRSMETSDQFQDIELGIIQNETVQKENVKRFTLTGRLKTLMKLEKLEEKKKVEPAPATAAAPQKK
jgi:type IV pilus assembly protein PilN